MVGNSDDHLRNHGFLRLGSGGWSLSPAFDINPNPEPGRRYLSTSIDGTSDEASLDLLLDVAELFRLSEAQARAVLLEVGDATERWRDVAAKAGLDRGSIGEMEQAFASKSLT